MTTNSSNVLKNVGTVPQCKKWGYRYSLAIISKCIRYGTVGDYFTVNVLVDVYCLVTQDLCHGCSVEKKNHQLTMASLQFENGPLDDDTLMKKRPANALFNVCNALCNARSADFFSYYRAL